MIPLIMPGVATLRLWWPARYCSKRFDGAVRRPLHSTHCISILDYSTNSTYIVLYRICATSLIVIRTSELKLYRVLSVLLLI